MSHLIWICPVCSLVFENSNYLGQNFFQNMAEIILSPTFLVHKCLDCASTVQS